MKFRNVPAGVEEDSIFATVSKQGIRLWFKDTDTTAIRLAVSHWSASGAFYDLPAGIRQGKRRGFSPNHQVAHVLNSGEGFL